MIRDTRIRLLDDTAPACGRKARYVLYWMQQSQRARFNPALEYAAEQANAAGLPLVVGFGLMDDYPEATERHYAFMLEGLRDVAADLKQRGVRFVVRHGQPPAVAVDLAGDASLVVCDRGYLRHQKRWRDELADKSGRRVIEVEGDVVVPVDLASDKQEYAARTLRPKIHRHWDAHLLPLTPVRLKYRAPDLPLVGRGRDMDVTDVDAALRNLKIDRGVGRSRRFVGGSHAARRRLKEFLAGHLHGYADGRNEPAAAHTSMLSAYLHFGQVSPVEIALAVRDARQTPDADRAAYLEELIVRRELSANFVHHCPDYDAYAGLPAWSRKTLAKHAADDRPHLYSRAQIEAGETADPYWNAAQHEMLRTGFMHNYMRMYWGKKIIEWTASPREAYETTLHLNNKYFLCGRDPNAYGNVGWVFGLHDRPWGPERPIFGTVRYMNAAGLERKFDMPAYIEQVSAMR